MVMDATRMERPARSADEEARARRRAAFRRGFLDVWRRAFSLGFSPARRPADTRPGWVRDAENLRRDWENVGGYIRRAMEREEAAHAKG